TTRQKMTETTTTDGRAACNSGFAKKRVQWLIGHSTSYQHLWFIDGLVLRNPLLRKAAKRCGQCAPTKTCGLKNNG
ncbi:MAG: hypothetical protein ACKPGW_26860, partial [Microcystis panniformis]